MFKINRLVLVVIVFLIASLTACVQDYEYYLYHDYIRENTDVTNINLVFYNNPTNLGDSADNTFYDVRKLEILDTLSSDDFEIFLNELSEIGGLSSKLEQYTNSPNGKGILITYQDGGFTLITVSNVNNKDCIFVGNYDFNSNIEGFYGISWNDMIKDFKELILKYFEVNIELSL